MKRSALLLSVAFPLLALAAAVFFLLRPGESGTSTGDPYAAASPGSREEAKARAESERAKDDEVVASRPPGLAAPAKKELAQQVLASAVHSTLRWRDTYGRIEDRNDGVGYTAGVVGFCTGTHDLLALVERYTQEHPDNRLAPFLPALREVDGTDSHEGLDPGFTEAWRAESQRPEFRRAQDEERDRTYFDPAVRMAKLDGLGTLGQFVYYDAMVQHGPDPSPEGFYGVREKAMLKARTPGEGGSEKAYLEAFLEVRRAAMRAKRPDADTSRVDTAQLRFLRAGNLELDTPLTWQVYGETYRLP
ncbi:chitosanase [Streptomyces sp. NPDC005931]|uniref:chitosanase n=1 Tax=Streptomyces sp. NPDC005931 TaxID=3364737 RepID=UPI00367368E5